MVHLPPRSFVSAVVTLLALVAMPACGSDSDSDSDSSSDSVAVTSPEEHIADDADVTAGLGRMTQTAATIAASVAAGNTVDDAQDQLEVDWQLVEGTFRQNEPDLYLQVEDDMGGIDQAAIAGDAVETTRFTTDLASAIASYLSKHP